MLMRASFGRVRRVSVLRDSLATIPGDGTQKINAAYAIGGPALAVETVEDFVGHGLRVNHVIEVSFGDFAALIDAMGGIDVTLRRCISSDPFGGRRFRLRRGEHHLDGRQALAFARVRKNRCSPNEDDRARARRQQQVLSAIRARLLSPAGFVRLPLGELAGAATLGTDMGGLGLIGLTADVVTGGSGRTRVLEPSGLRAGGQPRGLRGGEEPGGALPARALSAATRRSRTLRLPESDEPEDPVRRPDDFEPDFVSSFLSPSSRSSTRSAAVRAAPPVGALAAPALALAVVGVVEARALEVDGRRLEDPLHRARRRWCTRRPAGRSCAAGPRRSWPFSQRYS